MPILIYGTLSSFTFAAAWNTSVTRSVVVPLPAVATLTSLGSPFAFAISSATEPTREGFEYSTKL